MTGPQPRKPAGTPTGGQFAQSDRPAPEGELTANDKEPLSERSPVDIDTELAEVLTRYGRAMSRVDAAVNGVHALAFDSRKAGRGGYSSREWRLSFDEAVAKARDRLPADAAYIVDDAVEKVADARAAADALRAETVELDAEWRRRPWSRFYAVPGGHIHSSTACQTCRPTTKFSWAVSLSGASEEEAVNELGPTMCTVCFPSAPLEWTVGVKKGESNVCPGSGQGSASPPVQKFRNRYGTCQACGGYYPVLMDGRIRKHNKPKGS